MERSSCPSMIMIVNPIAAIPERLAPLRIDRMLYTEKKFGANRENSIKRRRRRIATLCLRIVLCIQFFLQFVSSLMHGYNRDKDNSGNDILLKIVNAHQGQDIA